MVFQFMKGARTRVPEAKTSQTKPLVAFHTSGRPVWSARDSATMIRTGFTSNPVGFRCVKMIAEAVSSIPLILRDGDAQLDAHPMLDLLRRPNQAQSKVELVESLIAQFLLTGNGYLEAAGGDDQVLPKELYVLRSDRMRLIPGADGWPAAYEYSVGAKKHRFDMRGATQPIFHFKSFHPTDDHYGLSPLQAAATALDVHTAASGWSKSLLDNAARPSGAIVYKGTDGAGGLGPDQYNRLVEEIEMNHSGVRNAGRPMLLEGGLDWKQIGFSPSDMEFQKTKESAAREIALAYGVPPMLLGMPGDNTYANYAEANRAFYRLTVLPLLTRLSASLSNWLCSFDQSSISFATDMDAIPALAGEREAQWKRISEAGFLSDAEKRALLGLPKDIKT